MGPAGIVVDMKSLKSFVTIVIIEVNDVCLLSCFLFRIGDQGPLARLLAIIRLCSAPFHSILLTSIVPFLGSPVVFHIYIFVAFEARRLNEDKDCVD